MPWQKLEASTLIDRVAKNDAREPVWTTISKPGYRQWTITYGLDPFFETPTVMIFRHFLDAALSIYNGAPLRSRKRKVVTDTTQFLHLCWKAMATATIDEISNSRNLTIRLEKIDEPLVFENKIISALAADGSLLHYTLDWRLCGILSPDDELRQMASAEGKDVLSRGAIRIVEKLIAAAQTGDALRAKQRQAASL